MFRRLFLILLLATPAFAEDKKSIQAVIGKLGHSGDDALKPAAFMFTPGQALAPAKEASFGDPLSVINTPITSTIAIAADGKSGWVTGMFGAPVICGQGDCVKMRREYEKHPEFHGTLLVDGGQPVMMHLGHNISDKDLADRVKNLEIGDVPAKLGAGAQPVVDLAKRTLPDAKAFAASISDRADVTLMGSAETERYVGGATVKKTLAGWNFGFEIKGNVAAGVTSSGTVAWLAANVDARAKNAKTTTPYHMTLICEKTGSDWKVVAAQFSFPENSY
jgi:hypothetical protein